MTGTRAILLLGLIPLLAAPAFADKVVLKGGKPFVGGVHRDDDGGVAVNPHNSRHPGMVFETRSIPRSQVKEVILEERPFQEFIRRMAQAKGDPDALLELAAWCGEEKLKDEREVALLEILRLFPDNEAALKEFGRSKFPRVRRGNPDFDAEAAKAIDAYLAIRDPEERKAAHGRLKRDASVTLPRHYLDRILRSLGQKTGRQDDRALTFRASKSPGKYTLFVPKEYDPRRPWPLILGLHGGGPGGKDRDTVVGSGTSAMNFYAGEAAKRGYLVVCPDALLASWGAKPNVDLIDAVMEEVQLLYHVDLNRVYLTGHSMGGFGAWAIGERMAERFAAVSPMAGGGSSFSRMVDTNTPIFIFHGADDGVVGPDRDRRLARGLSETKPRHDYVYTELNGVGHGFPPSIRNDLFDFFDVRRLCVLRGKRPLPPSARPRSSFLVKVGKEEKLFLGDPLAYGETGGSEGGKAEVKALLKEIRLGGGKAVEAADRLGELRAEKSVKPLSDILRHPATSDDVRIQAARALGMIGDGDAFPGLSAGLRSENPEVYAAAAKAMASIENEKAAPALLASLAHLDKLLESKRIGAGKIHISDWERWLAAYGAATDGLAATKPEGAAAALHRSPVKKVVCADWEVLHSPRVGQDPKVARRRLALTLAAALKTLDDPAGKAALDEMRESCSDDPEIVAACE